MKADIVQESDRLIKKGLTPLNSIYMDALNQSPKPFDRIAERIAQAQEMLLEYHFMRLKKGVSKFICVHCGDDLLEAAPNFPADVEKAKLALENGWVREGGYCRKCGRITEHQLIKVKQ